MKTAAIIQHIAIETIGTLGPVLEKLGYSSTVYLAGRDNLADLDPLKPDLGVVMGGPIGVYDADDYPFLYTELRWLRERLAADLPTLGICLGSQLIAEALGARVYPGHGTELGWGLFKRQTAFNITRSWNWQRERCCIGMAIRSTCLPALNF